jgi:hypothetical protein
MKTYSASIQKNVLLFILIGCSHICGIAQSNMISISINGIEYDDPAFSKLKENLQNNKNVTSVKPGYDQGIAKLTLNYTRLAQDLWEELPQTSKQLFKLTSIDDNHILLESKKMVKSTATPNASPATSTAATDNDCKNCYFNLCQYDGTKSFQGKIFKAINYDEGTYYYNCDNGVLVKKIVYKNGYGQTTSITNDTIFMSNAPIGTTWGVKGKEGEEYMFLGVKTRDFSRYALVAKGVSQTVNGKIYNNVIIVNYRFDNKDIFSENSGSVNYYYAKGVGLIKTENLDSKSDPLSALNKNNSGGSGEKSGTGGNDAGTQATTEKSAPANLSISSSKVPIDPASLVGTWRYQNGQTTTYWKLNADGTYDYYNGSMTEANRYKVKCNWELDGGLIMVTFCEGDKYKNRYDIEKKNDPATGKPTMVINGYAYFSMDNKKPW